MYSFCVLYNRVDKPQFLNVSSIRNSCLKLGRTLRISMTVGVSQQRTRKGYFKLNKE